MSESIQQSRDAFEMIPVQPVATRANLTSFTASDDTLHLIELLRRGNEAAFASLIDDYSKTMIHLAMVYVTAWSVAEEVVQETWMSVFEHLDHFEGRSSLKTWIFRILTNCAKTRARREARTVSFSSLSDMIIDLPEPDLQPDRFLPADHLRADTWVSFRREAMPEDRLLAQEMHLHLKQAIEALPSYQREIIILHDLEGWSPEDICHTLGLSAVHQRVLLHRARLKVRSALKKYMREE